MAEAVRTYPSELPVVALRQIVVFPLTLQPLAVNRPASVESVNRALADDRLLFLTLQNSDSAEDPEPDDVRRVGTIAAVRQMARAPNGGLHIIVEGLTRASAESVTKSGASLRATVSPIPEPVERTLEVDAYVRRLQELVERGLSIAAGLSQDLRGMVAGIDEPLRLAYLLSNLLDMKAEDKQQVLETDQLVTKLQAVAAALSREISLLELKSKIETETQEEMTDAQRQYYLRQQLKTIQDELGEGEQTDFAEVRKRIAGADLPDAVAAVAAREVERLERTTPASPDHQMIRTYLDWVLDVPWSTVTDDRLDPVAARQVLDEDHYDLDKVKERIVEYLAVQKLKSQQSKDRAPAGSIKGPILCFVGPPGVGKTSLGQSIARAMNRKFVRISLGGVRDEAEIRGHRRTYIGSIPGRIVQALKQAGAMNPVFMLDELDKLSVGFQGDPAAALLEVLDPAQNHSFRDHYLEINMDLSRVLFIATANQLGPVHPALLDRMEIISLAGYTADEKLHIATRYLVPRQLDEHALTAASVTFDDDAIQRIILDYTREAGVRSLERHIGAVARKIAARTAAADGDDAADDRSRRRHPRLPRPAALPRRGGVPRLASGRGDRRGLDRNGRRRAVHRGHAAPVGTPRRDPHRPAGRRDAGVGARRRQPHPVAGRRDRRAGGLPRQPRSAHPRAGRRDSERRAVGRRDDRDGDCVGAEEADGARGRGDDGRDHAERPRAAGRRDSREGARGDAARHQGVHPAGPQRAGPGGAAARAQARDAFHSRAHPRRSFARGAAGRDRRGRKMTRCAVRSCCCTSLHSCVSPPRRRDRARRQPRRPARAPALARSRAASS